MKIFHWKYMYKKIGTARDWRKHFAFIQILMDTGVKKIHQNLFFCHLLYRNLLERSHISNWLVKKDGILNKKTQAYDVIICDVYICNEQLSSTAKNLNCIKLAQNAADYYW